MKRVSDVVIKLLGAPCTLGRLADTMVRYDPRRDLDLRGQGWLIMGRRGPWFRCNRMEFGQNPERKWEFLMFVYKLFTPLYKKGD